MTQLVYAIADLDALFGFKPQRKGGSWWAKNWRRMVEASAFPPPLPGIQHPRWGAAAVRAWIAVHGGLAPLKEKLKGGPTGGTVRLPMNLAAFERVG